MSKVFVLDGRSMASVAIVRSLGKTGKEITLGNESRISATAFSKYVKHRIIYPSPEKSPDLFTSKMYNLIKKEKFDVVMPVRDATTILFSKLKDRLKKYTKIPIPDYETVMKGRNKGQTLKIALDIDIPCPKTYFKEEEISKLKESSEYPLLIRACESSGSRGIVLVDSPEKLMSEYHKLKDQFGEVMVQEYIPHLGEAYNVSALFNQYSEPRAVFAMKKIRQYPITGGPTAFAESIEGTEVKNYAIKLLKEMNWVGVAEVEFLFDERDKKPKLLEINPRFWNPLSLAIHSGVDFPSLLFDMALNGDIKPVTNYKLGIKWRYFIYDILCYMDSKNKFSSIPEFIDFQNVHDAILSFSDPGPTIGSLIDGFFSLLNVERKKHVFDRGLKIK